jgi:exopolysaccharide production protein ExoZ
MTANRIEGLDWLRGLMALSIMLYHFLSWKFGNLDAHTFLGRMGIYGVSTFYILSGISLAIVYNNMLQSLTGVGKFLIRRLFRILPMMWVATTMAILLKIIMGQPLPTAGTVFLNYTTLFGFLSPSSYLAVGAWSIGNEMVFYCFMPLMVYLYHRHVCYGNIVTGLSWVVSGVFSFVILDQNIHLEQQWAYYINPCNQLYLFLSGVALYYNFSKVKIPPKLTQGLVLSVTLLFYLLPASDNLIHIVTGVNRMILSLLCTLLVLLFWKIECKIPSLIKQGLNGLGIATYSVYLLHPFIFHGLTFVFKKLSIQSTLLLITTAVLTTVLGSLLVYRWYEEPFIRLGKKVTSGKTQVIDWEKGKVEVVNER